MAFKIKINELPSMEKDPIITTSIKDNPYRANAEIEKDEYVLRPDMGAIYKAVGKTHKQGGIETYLPSGSFIFSDDPTLHFNEDDHDVYELKKGPSLAKGKNTPADVLKRNIDTKHYNKMTSILDDKKKDEFAKRTAAMMLNKYENTAGRIAYVQEEKKDFPDGIPEFSQGTAPVYSAELKDEIMEQKQYMRYGGFMQKGGVSKNTRTKVIPNPQGVFDPNYEAYIAEHPDALLLSPEANQGPYLPLNSPQHLLGTGLYGSSKTNYDVNEFKQRHAWYMKDHPNWDPKNPKDVLDFQKKYNQVTEPIVGSPYFKTGADASSFRGMDSKYGRYTYNAPGVPVNNDEWTGPTPDALPPVTVTSSRKQPPGPQVPELSVPPGRRQNVGWEFSNWQKMNMAADAYSAASVREEFPYRSQVQSNLVELERVNPQAALNGANNAAYNAGQNNRGMNPYLAAASTASIYGQNLDARQQIQGQYDNQNVGIANQQNMTNAQIQGNDQRFNVGADQQYYRETVEGRKNYQNLKQASWNNFRNNVNSNVEQNQQLAYGLASQPNAPYGYDFKTGQFYLNGKNPLDVYTNPAGDFTNSIMQKIASNFDKLTPDQQVKFSKVLVGNKALTLPNYSNASFRKGGIKKNPYKK